jgi:CheY-like chemotaxis protein
VAGELLIADREIQGRRRLERSTHAAFRPVLCASRAAALAAAIHPFAAAVVDLELLDGSGLDLLAELRQLPGQRATPAALIARELDPGASALASALDVAVLAKPPSRRALDRFLNAAICDRLDTHASIRAALLDATTAWALRPHETAVVGAHVTAASRDDLAAQLGIPVDTLKSRIKQILHKSRHDSLRSIERALLRPSPAADRVTPPG